MSLDSVNLNIGTKEFAPGLGYVSLSRCKDFNKLKLEEPLNIERYKKIIIKLSN